jgi:thioesterase domain-containing protein
LFGIGQIGIHDDYFDLGGTSLLAVRLFGEIDKKFGKRLALSTLFDASTIDRLARVVADVEFQPSWESLVEIQPNGDGKRPPFFCIHSEGGNVLEYQKLTVHLGRDQPFYALQAQGLKGDRIDSSSIEDMASHYIKEMKQKQPVGPYYLGGYCLGGVVAFEMVRQLEADSEKIALLTLISSSTPQHSKSEMPNITVYRRMLYRMIERLELEANNLSVLSMKEKVSYFEERTGRIWRLVTSKAEGVAGECALRLGRKQVQHSRPYILEAIRRSQNKAFFSYTPSPIRSAITLFRTSKQPRARLNDSTLGWADLTRSGVKDYEINAFHKNILKEPNVLALAEKLKICLEKAQNGERV